MSAALDPPTRFLTGTFVDRALETEFQREHFAIEVRQFTRFSIGLATAVYLAYGYQDGWLVPSVAATAWAIRYGVFAPIAAVIVALMYTRLYERVQQGAMLVFGLAVNLVVLWIGAIAPPAGFFIYTSYAILFVTLGPFLAKMSVVTQLLYTALSIAMFVTFALRVSHPDPVVFTSIAITLASLGGIGALVARQLEIQARQMFLARKTIAAERGKSEALLLNILPESVAGRLKADNHAIADGFAEVTVLFADIVGFTKLSQRLTPQELVSRLNELFSTFDDLAGELGVEKIKTIGDAYMAVGGLVGRKEDHAQAMAEMALGMLTRVEEFGRRYGEDLDVRVGLNSGPVVAGVIGKKKFIYDVWGDTVNTASRMESHGTPGTVHVTEATRRLLERDYAFDSRGTIEIKGKGPMETYFLGAKRAA